VTADQLAQSWTRHWPRASPLSQKQNACQVRHWGEVNAGRDIRTYTREEARQYALEYPSRARYLRAMFNDAEADGLLGTPRNARNGNGSLNPFASLGVQPPRRELHFPTHEELDTLLRAAEEPLRGRIAFAAYTGLRRGEMLAVRAGDFA